MKNHMSRNIAAGSYVFLLLILFIGLFSVYAMNAFYTNSQEVDDINAFSHNLHISIEQFWALIEAESLEEYEEIKYDIEFQSSGNEIAFSRVQPLLVQLDLEEKYLEDINEFETLSNDILEIKKESLLKEEEFKEKAKTEKKFRHQFRDLAKELGDLEFSVLVWRMQYESKETFYQYKDQEHLDELIIAIGDVGTKLNDFALANEAKLLEDINSYKIIAESMGETAIQQRMVEDEKRANIKGLRKISEKIEEDEAEISKTIRDKSKNLARNNFVIILFITVAGIVAVFFFQRYLLKKRGKKRG